MEKRKIYKIKYSINYSSGKKWITENEFIALSEYGAIEFLKWLKSGYDISIISIDIIGYIGEPIYRNPKVLGDF